MHEIRHQDSLTLLTKADVGMVDLERELVMLPDLICECYDDTLILGESQGLTVTMGACEGAMVLGDRNRLRQLLLNLADNAVEYNKPDSSITFSLRNVANFAEIVITNTGRRHPAELILYASL
ncbi:MAG: HAMP domain-containing histidine kinase [Candidatus Hydrogenedentes bacterium]|nr:HAMP domain-containing histidine kinase [Candidatus Hydrogenedentota bacterium]